MRLSRTVVFQLISIIVLSLCTVAGAASVTLDVSGWVEERDQAVIAAFEAEHPDIKINYRVITGNETLFVQLAAGEGPDVMTISWANIGDFMRAGLLENLSPYIKTDTREIDPDDIFAAALAGGEWNKQQYALPATLGAQGLYLNTDLFAQHGLALPPENWSWEDFARLAKRLTRVDSSGNKVQWGWQNTTDYAPWMSVVYSYGGRLLSPGFTAPVFNTPATVAGLKMLQQMVYEDGVTGGAFLKNNVAMVIRPAETVTTWLAGVNFRWQGFLMPSGPAGRALMGGAHQLAINKASKNKAAAWTFVKYYVGKAGQKVTTQFATVPFRRSLFRTAIEANPGIAVLVQQMDDWIQYTNRLHNEINRIWQPVLKDLYAGAISPVQAASTIQDKVAAIW